MLNSKSLETLKVSLCNLFLFTGGKRIKSWVVKVTLLNFQQKSSVIHQSTKYHTQLSSVDFFILFSIFDI